jgi:septal ring factor EnvC (AmiA/AmiB activator)
VQNYEVQPGHTLIMGVVSYTEGNVLPEWFANRDNGLAGRVTNGCLAPTAKPVNVTVAAPAAKTADDPTEAIVAEADRYRRENAEYAASNRELVAVNEELTKANASLTAALGKATADIAHLTAACDDHQGKIDALEKKIADLTAELETATAPAA